MDYGVIKCSEDVDYFIENMLSISCPERIPFKLNKTQVDILNGLKEDKKHIQYYGDRQLGKTSVVCAYLLWKAMESGGTSILISGYKHHYSKFLINTMRNFVADLPDCLSEHITHTQNEIKISNNSSIKIVEANIESIIGTYFNILYVDEPSLARNYDQFRNYALMNLRGDKSKFIEIGSIELF